MTTPYEIYLNSWIIVYHNQDRIPGCLKNIKDGILYLNPFQSFRPKGRSIEYFLKEDPRGYAIPMMNIRIEPTTKKEVEKDIYEMNRYFPKKDIDIVKELKVLKDKKK
jgi:hypothetical protein